MSSMSTTSSMSTAPSSPPLFKRERRTNLDHLSPDEKRAVKKKLNNESVRRMRQRAREQDEDMRRTYEHNEHQIRRLERRVDELSRQLYSN